MKRLILILSVVLALATGCRPEPFANAVIAPNPAYVGEDVEFRSVSTNVDYVEWEMGDGFLYSDPEVTHYFVDPGIYDVKLKAFGVKGGVDVGYFPVEVIGSELTVVVREYYDPGETPGLLVAGARVRLYPTVDDWVDETNLVVEGYTNNYGEVTFDNLSYQRYYLDVWGPFHDNYQLAEDDLGFIETAMLEGIYLWTFEALVDYYPNGKKSTGMERKNERKAGTGTADDGRKPGDQNSKVKRAGK